MTGGAGRLRAVVTLLLWLAFLGCVLLGLHGLGGALAPPPLTDPSGVNDWLEQRQPAEAAFAVLRLAGLATTWYLVGAIVLDALAHLSRVPAMVRCADPLTIPALRRLAHAAAGVSAAAAAITTGAVMPSAGLHRSSPPSAEAISLLAHAAAPSAGAGGGDGSASGGNEAPSNSGDNNGDQQKPPLPTLRRLPGTPGTPPPPPASPPELSPAPPTDQWEVRPGQHFWAVAESILAGAWQRAPSDDEVDPYWRQLVAANRSILRDPDNPDLLYPGQVMTVPPPPSAPPAPDRTNRGSAQPR